MPVPRVWYDTSPARVGVEGMVSAAVIECESDFYRRRATV
jgi:hypothetical protein